MAIYNTKGKKWETTPINEWESLEISASRFFENAYSTFKVKRLCLTNAKVYIKRLEEIIKLGILELDLHSNDLTFLPEFFSDFTSLKVLDLSFNNLKALPPKLFKTLNNLTSLNLSNNDFDQFPDQVHNLANLTTLNLSSNKIADIDCHTFDKFKSFLTIYLDGCLFSLSLTEKIMTYVNTIKNGPKIFLSVHDDLTQISSEEIRNNTWSELTNVFKENTGTVEMDQINREREIAARNAESYVLVTARQSELRRITTYVPSISHQPQIDERVRNRSNNSYNRSMEEQAVLLESEQQLRLELEQEFRKQRSCLENLITDLKHVDKEKIKTWLIRIYDIFKSKNKTFFKELCVEIGNYLQEADNDQELRDILYSIIDESLMTCGDRVALSVLYFGMHHSLHKCKNNLTDWKPIYTLLINGTWTINALEIFARYKVSTLSAVDELEVYLGYLIKLKNDLSIPIIIQSMMYPSLSNLTEEDLNIAKKYVLKNRINPDIYLPFLVEQDLWVDVLKHLFPTELTQITAIRNKDDDCVKAFQNYKISLIDLTKQLLDLPQAKI